MSARITWEAAARSQYQQLPANLQASVRSIIDNLGDNPFTGWYVRTELREGKQVYIHAYAGAQMVVEYYRRNLFRRTITIRIVAVYPMDWPTTDEYEETTQP